MQALVSEEIFTLNCIYPKKLIYPLLLPSHNCINNYNVQFSRYTELQKKLNEVSVPRNFSQSLKRSGGPKWTRTIDLTIISRVL